MIVRVNWNQWKKDACENPGPNAVREMYHVYQCDNYMVEITGYSGSSDGPCGPSQLMLHLDGRTEGAHMLAMSGGDEAFIMNDNGKTIDIIRTV